LFTLSDVLSPSTSPQLPLPSPLSFLPPLLHLSLSFSTSHSPLFIFSLSAPLYFSHLPLSFSHSLSIHPSFSLSLSLSLSPRFSLLSVSLCVSLSLSLCLSV